jgi:tRNA pseudouridine55 synthase
VTIFSIDLLTFDPPDATIDVHCSAGTYIRSLAHDVGQHLGCGAHLAALRRTSVGDFTLERAISLEAFESAVRAGSWAALIHPLDTALSRFPALTLSETEAALARHGRPVSRGEALEANLVRVYDPDGEIVGVMRFDPIRRELKPAKILSPTHDT